jgi:hypothetical protein
MPLTFLYLRDRPGKAFLIFRQAKQMITQNIRAIVLFVIFASAILISRTDATAADAQTPPCALSISSSPFRAEIYLNRQPGKRTSPDAHTPALFKNIKDKQVSLTLFKKGYLDTTLFLDLTPAATATIDISMVPLHVQALPAQERFLRERFCVQLGKYCLISTPVFAAAGAGLLYYAGKNQKKADEARSYLDKTIRQQGPDYDAMQLQYKNETRKQQTKFITGIVMFGLAAVDLGAGIILFF